MLDRADDLQTGVAPLRVSLNGEAIDTAAPTLEALLVELGFAGARVATAVNGAFVPRGARAAQRLSPGDRIEIVAPRQGG